MTKNDDLQLEITNGVITSPNGTVGYVDYGQDFIYVCFYWGKLIVAEYNNLDSLLVRLVRETIVDKYYYAFKILCSGGVTAVVKWTDGDIILVGVTAGFYENGERIWTNAIDIKGWPGKRAV